MSVMKLDGVKIGKSSVCFNPTTGTLRMGLKGKTKSPVEFAMDLPKAVRRAFRKMLHAAGYQNIAAATVPPKQRKPKIHVPDLDEWEFDQREEDERIYQQEIGRQLRRA